MGKNIIKAPIKAAKKVVKASAKLVSEPLIFSAEQTAKVAGEIISPFASLAGKTVDKVVGAPPAIEVPQAVAAPAPVPVLEEIDETANAAQIVRRRQNKKRSTQTLLTPGLGGTQASVTSKTLLGS